VGSIPTLGTFVLRSYGLGQARDSPFNTWSTWPFDSAIDPSKRWLCPMALTLFSAWPLIVPVALTLFVAVFVTRKLGWSRPSPGPITLSEFRKRLKRLS